MRGKFKKIETETDARVVCYVKRNTGHLVSPTAGIAHLPPPQSTRIPDTSSPPRRRLCTRLATRRRLLRDESSDDRDNNNPAHSRYKRDAIDDAPPSPPPPTPILSRLSARDNYLSVLKPPHRPPPPLHPIRHCVHQHATLLTAQNRFSVCHVYVIYLYNTIKYTKSQLVHYIRTIIYRATIYSAATCFANYDYNKRRWIMFFSVSKTCVETCTMFFKLRQQPESRNSYLVSGVTSVYPRLRRLRNVPSRETCFELNSLVLG